MNTIIGILLLIIAVLTMATADIEEPAEGKPFPPALFVGSIIVLTGLYFLFTGLQPLLIQLN